MNGENNNTSKKNKIILSTQHVIKILKTYKNFIQKKAHAAKLPNILLFDYL